VSDSNIRARVASADVWLQDSARIHSASGRLGFAQHNENARALLTDLLAALDAAETARDALAYDLAYLHDSLWIAYKGSPRESWEDACEDALISIGYIMGIHEITVPREIHVTPHPATLATKDAA
jgi:hypothetical protein